MLEGALLSGRVPTPSRKAPVADALYTCTMGVDDDDSTDEHHDPAEERRFHGWRLIGVIMLVVLALAVISFVVDWMAIGPLEGRVF